MIEKKQPHWVLQKIAEDKIPRKTVDLWPKISTSVQADLPFRSRLYFHNSKRLRLVFLLAAFLSIVFFLFSTPEVKGFALDFIERMGIAFSIKDQYKNTPIQSPASVILNTPQPSLSEDEIRKAVLFPLLLPTSLSRDLDYIHRSIYNYGQFSQDKQQGGGKQVDIIYFRSSDYDFQKGALFFHANDGPIASPPLLAESKKQETIVNSVLGIYIHGGWGSGGKYDSSIKHGNLSWDDNEDDAYLTWIQDGITYLIEAHNLGMKLGDLLMIASSLH